MEGDDPISLPFPSPYILLRCERRQISYCRYNCGTCDKKNPGKDKIKVDFIKLPPEGFLGKGRQSAAPASLFAQLHLSSPQTWPAVGLPPLCPPPQLRLSSCFQ